VGREVRRVPATWEHPRDERGSYRPLHDHFNTKLADWDEQDAKWSEGLRSDFHGGWEPRSGGELTLSFEDWYGERPDPQWYMPDFPESERTHYQLYESVSEGTPLSPPMPTEEALATYMATHPEADEFNPCSYDQWLAMIRAGSCMSFGVVNGRMLTGVEMESL
jgi:hypothetical protein